MPELGWAEELGLVRHGSLPCMRTLERLKYLSGSFNSCRLHPYNPVASWNFPPASCVSLKYPYDYLTRGGPQFGVLATRDLLDRGQYHRLAVDATMAFRIGNSFGYPEPEPSLSEVMMKTFAECDVASISYASIAANSEAWASEVSFLMAVHVPYSALYLFEGMAKS